MKISINALSISLIIIFATHANDCFSASGTLYDYVSLGTVSIPDNGGWDGRVNWPITLSGAPSDAIITKVDVEYWINHTYVGDITAELTTQRGTTWYGKTLWNREGGSADNIAEKESGLTTWNGLSPNGTWYLVAYDSAVGDTGHIDAWKIWVYWQTQEFEVYSTRITGTSDSDGDGYVSQLTVEWDADVTFGSRSVYAKVYADDWLSFERYLGQSSTYTISGSTEDWRTFSVPVDTKNLSHATWDFKVVLHDANSGAVLATWDYNRTPLNNINIELSSEEIQSFSVYSTRITGTSDSDGDGYVSQLTVEWDADVTFGSRSVYAKVYADDWLSFERYLGQSSTYTVSGDAADWRTFSVPVDTKNLSHGSWDFKVVLHDANSGAVLATWDYNRTPLNNINVELSSEEIQSFSVFSTRITGTSDSDGDGYVSQLTVEWDANVNFGSRSVYAKVYADDWLSFERYLGQSSTYTISGGTADWRTFSVPVDTKNLSHGSWDFKVVLHDANSGAVLATWDYNRTPLDNIKVELSSEEIQSFSVFSTRISGAFDSDGDGYASQLTVEWDANVSFGSRSVYAKIYADDWLSFERYLGQSSTYTISGDTADWRTFSVPVDTKNLSHGSWDFKVVLHDANSGAVLVTWDYNRTPLDNIKVEISSEEVQSFSVTDAMLENLYDPDGDGYSSRFDIKWKSKVSFGTADIIAEVWADSWEAGINDRLVASKSYTVSSTESWQNVMDILTTGPVPNLDHRTWDFYIILKKNGVEVVRLLTSDDIDLQNVRLELPSEETFGSLNISVNNNNGQPATTYFVIRYPKTGGAAIDSQSVTNGIAKWNNLTGVSTSLA